MQMLHLKSNKCLMKAASFKNVTMPGKFQSNARLQAEIPCLSPLNLGIKTCRWQTLIVYP
jgi:hypothetical protein